MSLTFTKAERKKSRLRLGLTGPSGAGKTYSALLIAKGMGGRIAVLDTEKGSASLYTHLVDYDVLELQPPYAPERFIEAINAAEAEGYDILIMDSITHEWNGSGGCLELNDQIATSKYRGNTWSAWNETSARHRAFIDKMMQSKMHIIATMRSKTETAQQENIQGKKSVIKIGMKAEQRESVEYEFTVVLDITHEGHYAVASKDRTGLFVDKDPKTITTKTGKTILNWLEQGIEPKNHEPTPDYTAMIHACTNMTDLASCWQMIPAELRKTYEHTKNEQKTLLTQPETPTTQEEKTHG